MSRRTEKLSALTLGLLLLGFFLWSQRSHPPVIRQAAANPGPPRAVNACVARKVQLPIRIECSGTVRSRRFTVIASRLLAEIKEIRKQPGDTVRAGEPLVILDSANLTAAAEQAEANLRSQEEGLKEARAALHRIRNLHQKEAATQQELDVATFRLADAAARRDAAAKVLEGARVNLGHAVIAASFDGMVVEKLAEPGDITTPGKPILAVYDPTNVRLEALVEESLIWRLKLRDRLLVSLDASGRKLEGEVSEIVPAVDPFTRTGTVKIDLPTSEDVRPGAFGRAQIPAGTREAIVLPLGAVLTRGQLELVFAVEVSGADASSHTRLLLVRTGKRISAADAGSSDSPDGFVEIVAGLEAGARVVATVTPDLADNLRIQVKGLDTGDPAGSREPGDGVRR